MGSYYLLLLEIKWNSNVQGTQRVISDHPYNIDTLGPFGKTVSKHTFSKKKNFSLKYNFFKQPHFKRLKKSYTKQALSPSHPTLGLGTKPVGDQRGPGPCRL